MNQHSSRPTPQFTLLQAKLQRHHIDCYQISKTHYYSCIHRPSSSRCLIHWWENQWKLAGDAKLPAYKIAQWVLNKLANQTGSGDHTTTSEELSHITTDTNTIEEIAP